MAQGMKNTVLDHLPAGTDADLAKGKIPHTLPDGVTNRAVYNGNTADKPCCHFKKWSFPQFIPPLLLLSLPMKRRNQDFCHTCRSI